MDTQLERGVLDVCVLSAIRERDSYGYQIIKDLSPCIRLSESTLYTILKRLETAGLLTVRSAEHNGRLWTSGRSLWRSTALFPERRRLRMNREEFFASLRQRLDRQRPAQRPQCRDAHGRDDHRRSESARRRRRGGAQRAHHDRRHPARARRRRLARNRRDPTGDVTDTLCSEKRFAVHTGTGDVSVPATASGGVCEIETSTGDVHIELA